jgi:UDP-N-acetylglucosamine--N-acetylmuramyl-(pentapeptide) pyrophosphoryl-undecaprenol N-acetylglucosamine transferase
MSRIACPFKPDRRARIVLAGGATGGHLFPAIALAEELQARGHEPFFICTDRPFDLKHLRSAGFPHWPLPSAGATWRSAGAALGSLFHSVRRAAQVIAFLKPSRVVGFGGHGSAAALAAACVRRLPISLFEQNSMPGKVTRAFASRADRIYLQWPDSARFFGGLRGRLRVVGSPLRQSLQPRPSLEARAALGIPSDRWVLTVLGGSQGAQGLNGAVVGGLDGLADVRDRLHVVHQTGSADLERVRKAYAAKRISAKVEPFFSNMGDLYSATDLILCRAGALTLQELAAFKLPAVLVPLPTAAGDHQAVNARDLARRGCVRWTPQATLDSGFLRRLVLSFEACRGRFAELGERLGAYFPNSALKAFVEDLAGGGNPPWPEKEST